MTGIEPGDEWTSQSPEGAAVLTLAGEGRGVNRRSATASAVLP